MIDLPQLQILAQLLDNMAILSNQLEKSYNQNDSELFKRTKAEILSIQNKISGLL
ncbi:hypothetical protein J4218_06355 [Candidatus Pacearchaeota archaeon]|nr:hypothetical protein [Candidatus Pacearchaeota archaeon]